MNPDDNLPNLDIMLDEWSAPVVNVGDIRYDPSSATFTIAVSGDTGMDYLNINDYTYGVSPLSNEPTVYTSYEQREAHSKYPALEKSWQDYLAMYALSKGEPPIVE